MKFVAPELPSGECPICKKPYSYSRNPAVTDAMASTSFYRRGYWIAAEHPACEEAILRREKMERGERLREERLVVTHRLLRQFGLPKHLDDRTFLNFKVTPDNERAVKVAKAWMPGAQGLLFMGPPGRGKSHLAAAIVNHWSNQDVQVAYENINRLLNTLRAGYGDSTFEERLGLITSSRIPILVLDDLGTEKSTDWSEPTIFQVLDERLKQRLATFVTTNLTAQELAKKYHERIPSRLKEMCTWIEMGGPDWREGMASQRADALGLPTPPRITRN